MIKEAKLDTESNMLIVSVYTKKKKVAALPNSTL